MRWGACVGTVVPELAKLNLDWVFGVGANAMAAEEFLRLPSGVEYVPLTFENPPRADWQNVLANPHYRHKVLIGNEPHGGWDNYRPIAEIVQAYAAQMRALREMDPQVKFILTAGTQGQLPYNRHNSNPPLIGELWKGLPADVKEWIFAVHCHIYPRWVSDDPQERWNVQNFVRYLRGLRRWLWEQHLDCLKIWVSEFGFEGYFADDPKEYRQCVHYTRNLLRNDEVGMLCSRLSFYVATGRTGDGGSNAYLPLLDAEGNLTGLGQVWKKK